MMTKKFSDSPIYENSRNPARLITRDFPIRNSKKVSYKKRLSCIQRRDDGESSRKETVFWATE